MVHAVIVHQGNLFWFLVLISESFIASITGISAEQAANFGELDFVFHVASRDLEGLHGSVAQAPKAEEPCLGRSGWVSCHSNRDKNDPTDFFLLGFQGTEP